MTEVERFLLVNQYEVKDLVLKGQAPPGAQDQGSPAVIF